MHSSPASRSKPRPRRKAPIATLIALCALTAGAQTLAPATATAMDDQGGAGECRSFAGAPPGAGWNGTEFCTLTDGSAGGGGGATGGDGSGGGTVGNEVIVIVDPYSPPQPTNPLCKSARHCLPGQSGGGRPLGFNDDGRNPREPKGRGSGQAPKKPEAPKGKAKKPTKEECFHLMEVGQIGSPEILVAKKVELDSLLGDRDELEVRRAYLYSVSELPAPRNRGLEIRDVALGIYSLTNKTHDLRRQIENMEDAWKQWQSKSCARMRDGAQVPKGPGKP